jgi:hypothetical protein
VIFSYNRVAKARETRVSCLNICVLGHWPCLVTDEMVRDTGREHAVTTQTKRGEISFLIETDSSSMCNQLQHEILENRVRKLLIVIACCGVTVEDKI